MGSRVAILGGGLVGLVAALAFSRLGWRVRLIEERPMNLQHVGALDARGIALSLSSIHILQSLGFDPCDVPGGADIRQIHVSSSGRFGLTRLSASQLGVERMGRVVEYSRLNLGLLEKVCSEPAVEVLAGARFTHLQQDDQSVAVDIEIDDQSRQCHANNLLLVADGGHSSIAGQLGIGATRFDYRQAALAATIEVERPQPGRAYERFTPHGPLAMLPLEGQRYALIWTADHARIGLLESLSDDAFLAELQAAFGFRLGYLSAVGRRDRFNLGLTRADSLVAGRCLLVGNAANALHPVAGQGFNLALRDLGELFDLLSEPGESVIAQMLEAYPVRRKPDHDRTIALGHGLVQLFSTDRALQQHVASLGLSLLDLCPPAKQAFAWQAMGFGNAANSLMRGSV